MIILEITLVKQSLKESETAIDQILILYYQYYLIPVVNIINHYRQQYH